MPDPRRIRLVFPAEHVAAEAELLWDQAPQVCRELVARLPFSGTTHHAIYSGSECVLLLDEVLRLDAENATADTRKGDVAFAWMAAGSHYGVTADFAEICWFYDVDGAPRMWEGPVPVSVFARIVEPADAFFTVCRRMRRVGIKPFRVELVES
jgi:hypothetical protein